MTKKRVSSTMLTLALLCGYVAMAQAPVQNIDPKMHPNLAAAQTHLIEATNSIAVAQRDDKYDMQGHAEKARSLIMQASQELKYAAEAANAAAQKRK